MQRLSAEQFESWLSSAKILERDDYGVKVLALADGSFLKLFRFKRLLSKNRLFPPAWRFQRNAATLQRLGVPCPTVIATYRLAQPARSLVHYTPLEGVTLRDLQRTEPQQFRRVLPRLGEFIARLHDLGIYFRSLHLGNIVLTPGGDFGLIDIADLSCRAGSLSLARRKRNMHHLFRYGEDWGQLSLSDKRTLQDGYANAVADAKHISAMSNYITSSEPRQ